MLILASFYIDVLLLLFVLVSLMLTAVILIQKPRGGGLSGAFGGAGGGAQSAFGSRTGDFLTWFTVGCFVAFLLLAMGLTWTIRPPNEAIEEEATPATQPAEPENAAAPPAPANESSRPETSAPAPAPTSAPAAVPEATP
jgi:preprotein translocase subunit SecG